MNLKKIFLLCLAILYVFLSNAQENSYKLTLNVSVAANMQNAFKPDGRLFIFLTRNSYGEPRNMTWPAGSNFIFARNFYGLDPGRILTITDPEGWSKTPDWTFDHVPEGTYYLQVLWDQDTAQSGIEEAGNLYSTKQKIEITQTVEVKAELDHITADPELTDNELVKLIDIKSDTLSRWWGRPVHVKASLLLPRNYEKNSGRAYPIRYNIAGYGGRYSRVNRLANSRNFMNWWLSGDAPEVINVFLDGYGPFGDCYQMDSENSGPYGYSLIHELIPYIEKEYRGTSDATTRFVDGCSTGGWVSLGLQLYYPETFNGVFSYSPDAIDFSNYQLVNIYKDKNAFVNEYGYLRPVMRLTDGEPVQSWKEFFRFENVLGHSNTYLDAGGQMDAHAALYGPKGKNGLPEPLIDPVTGDINPRVAEVWKKYDFRLYAEKNWATLGPEIQGKIYIWMGDMDHFYLNLGTRGFADFLKTTKDPASDAEIVFTPMEGHCQEFSDRKVLEQIKARLEKIK